jgi:hypothetical protein
MHVYFDPTNEYLTIDVGRLEEAADTLDVAPGASVVVDRRGMPVSIELPGPAATADDALRAVARRWPTLDDDDLLAAAHAAYAAPDRDITVGTRAAV